MLYLRVRHYKPRKIYEQSPFHGYSTCWMLLALRDNGFGKLVR